MCDVSWTRASAGVRINVFATVKYESSGFVTYSMMPQALYIYDSPSTKPTSPLFLTVFTVFLNTFGIEVYESFFWHFWGGTIYMLRPPHDPPGAHYTPLL